MITEFSEHPLELNAIDFDHKAVGRKVWWRGEPAIVESFISGQACVILKPDGIPRFTVPPEFAEEEPDYYEDVRYGALLLKSSCAIWSKN